MKLTTKAMVACFAMVASVAFAEATEEHAVARQALMKTIGGKQIRADLGLNTGVRYHGI